jgi:hypothetical protein
MDHCAVNYGLRISESASQLLLSLSELSTRPCYIDGLSVFVGKNVKCEFMNMETRSLMRSARQPLVEVFSGFEAGTCELHVTGRSRFRLDYHSNSLDFFDHQGIGVPVFKFETACAALGG